MCDDLLTKWGYAARGAGASEAKLVSTIVAKVGVKRKVLGVVHMVAGWKEAGTDQNRRMNLIFRYVPEGNWALDDGDGIRLVDERGNFILVREDLLQYPELKTQKVVIHFHGPGIRSEIEAKPRSNVTVVSRVLDSAEVTDAVFD
jgi:hypothetical protein